MENIFNRYKRYIKYIIQYIFFEKLRGLDFSMRDTSLLKDTGGKLHGYSKTDEAHAKKIFLNLGQLEEKSIIDIGCGKGAFLREACKYNFKNIAGIEYSKELANIAQKNFSKLSLTPRVQIINEDATCFGNYKDFDVFYFFNPFDSCIMEKVMQSIVNSIGQRKIWIILHHPVAKDVVLSFGAKEIVKLFDKVKSYETIIYELN